MVHVVNGLWLAALLLGLALAYPRTRRYVLTVLAVGVAALALAGWAGLALARRVRGRPRPDVWLPRRVERWRPRRY